MEKCLTHSSSKCRCWNFISSKFWTHLLHPYYAPCCKLANGALSMSDAGFALRTCSSGRRIGLPWITGLATPSDVLGLAAFDLALVRKQRQNKGTVCVWKGQTLAPSTLGWPPSDPSSWQHGPRALNSGSFSIWPSFAKLGWRQATKAGLCWGFRRQTGTESPNRRWQLEAWAWVLGV